MFDWREWWRDELEGETFDVAIANPPFGKVKRNGTGPRYRGPEFELHVIDIAGEIADRGVFIIPQQSAPFRYSGTKMFDRRTTGRGVEFEKQTGFSLQEGCGVDTAFYKDEWKDTVVICEIVCAEFTEIRQRRDEERKRTLALLVVFRVAGRC